jgi:heparin/heparan-sulfate lyase
MAGLAVGDDFGGECVACARPMPMGREPHHARDYVNDALYRTERMFACYRHFMEGASFSQSYAYSLAYIGEIPYFFQLAETGLGLPFFQEHAWFANAAPWYTYALRSDESFIRYGDFFCRDSIFKGGYLYRAMAAVASRYHDGVARWWTNRFKVSGCEPDAFIFYNRDGEEAKLDTLPRTRHFEPMGISIARGDFANGTLAAFKCSPLYLHNHCHRDQNSLTVYHKGELAIDAGSYDGYESPHWKNYYVRTIAHNTLVVHDPDEQMLMRAWPLANDGGQRFVNFPHFAAKRFEDIRKECFRDGRTLAYREGDGFSYVCGDASNCYRPEKLKRFLRHVVFVLDWPHTTAVSMVVLDEVEVARSGLVPRILLHTVGEPERKDACVTARQDGGRLNMHVLLPQAATIETIGGPGKECWVDGKNFPVDLDADENLRRSPAWHKPGEWRVEVSPADKRALKTTFLTLWVSSDANAPAAPQPVLDADASGWVVRQGDLSVGLFKPGLTRKLDGKRSIAVELAVP